MSFHELENEVNVNSADIDYYKTALYNKIYILHIYFLNIEATLHSFYLQLPVIVTP